MSERLDGRSGRSSEHPTVAERYRLGKSLRKRVPRSSHGEWSPAQQRTDPVSLLEGQNTDRLQWLVPVRRGRMIASPFTFYRGAARIMASDLATTPATGLHVQACGDAHLSIASLERRLVFDVNDFDETLAGPWEWDAKRLAASFMIAGQHREFDEATCRRITRRSIRAYRESMAKFAEMRTLDVWYSHLAVEDLAKLPGLRASRVRRFSKKSRSRDHLRAFSKLVERDHGETRIRSDPPVLLPLRDLPGRDDAPPLEELAHEGFESYKWSLADNRRRLLDRFHLVDTAVKVVGVGSVGTRCVVVLLVGHDRGDHLLLQFKEATRSVLAEHLPAGPYANEGERVVRGQRLMQSVSDICLGWTRARTGRDYYGRQLHDWKGSAEVEQGDPDGFLRYARLCGWTLARAHARSGDPIAIAGYLGSGDNFDSAATVFAEAYAGQNRLDFEAFTGAIAAGRLEADTRH